MEWILFDPSEIKTDLISVSTGNADYEAAEDNGKILFEDMF